MNEQGTLNLSQGDRQLEPAPCALASRTSRAAAGKLTDVQRTEARRRVFNLLRDTGGLTDREGSKRLKMWHSTYVSTRNALVRAGLVFTECETLCVETGKHAAVWELRQGATW